MCITERITGLIKTIYFSLIPLFILLFFAAIASILSYFILLMAGDVITMSKLISKSTQVFLLLCIFPIRRYLNLSWSDVGFAHKAVFFRQLKQGLILGLLTLLPVMIVLYGLDINVIDQNRNWGPIKIILRILLALFLALLIAFGEEPLFSGILLAGLRKKLAVGFAVFLSSSYYATFHFVKTKTKIPYEDLSLVSGFRLMGEAFANVLNPEIISALLSLFIVGLFLAMIRIQIKSSIGICIGCHAAWVWQIKIMKDFFNTNRDSEYYYLVSAHYDGVVGPLVTVWLSLALIGYFMVKKYLIKPTRQ